MPMPMAQPALTIKKPMREANDSRFNLNILPHCKQRQVVAACQKALLGRGQRAYIMLPSPPHNITFQHPVTTAGCLHSNVTIIRSPARQFKRVGPPIHSGIFYKKQPVFMYRMAVCHPLPLRVVQILPRAIVVLSWVRSRRASTGWGFSSKR